MYLLADEYISYYNKYDCHRQIIQEENYTKDLLFIS